MTEQTGWLRAIDEALVVHHIGIADPTDDYETAKRKLNVLLCVAQQIGEDFGKQALNLPEQEPVACSNTFSCRCPKHFNSRTTCKPLTDEAIMDMVRDMSIQMRWPSTPLEIARAIERAHGITGEQQ